MTAAAQLSQTAHRSSGAHAHASRQILGLDLIRFVAALLVMAFHLGFWIWASGSNTAGYHFLARYTWFGWIGVHIFFVLSGFVIAYSAERATASGFVKGRIVRLYPSAWICATVTFVALAVCSGHLHNRWLLGCWTRSAFLLPVGPWVDTSYWTLGVEITFYLTTALLLAAGWFRHLARVMTAIAILDIAALTFTQTILHSAAPHAASSLHFASFVLQNRWAELLLLQYGSLFALGVLLWLCLLHRTTPARIVAIAVSCVGALLAIQHQANYVQGLAHSHYSLALPIAFWALSVVAIILSVKYNAAISARLGQRGATIARKLGLLTYPLYLLHQQISYLFIPLLHHYMPDILAMFLSAVFVLALSYFVSNSLEKPIQQLLKELLHSSLAARTPISTLP